MKTIDKRLVEFTMKIFIQIIINKDANLYKIFTRNPGSWSHFPKSRENDKEQSINVFPCIQCTTPRVFMLTASSLSACLQG